MKFVFWQNVVSIHQSAFIKALSEDNDVTLVAQEEVDSLRSKEGWTVPSMGSARVIVNPDAKMMADLLERDNTEHVFSGINGFPMVYQAFKMAVRRGLKVSILAEPYEWAGAKGLMRQLMYRWLFIRYGRNIKHLFATGNMGVKCYRRAGLPARKLHQWGYFTEQNRIDVSDTIGRDKPNIIFIGKIDDRKNILALAKCAAEISDKFNHFYIIGTGPLENGLRGIIGNVSNIDFIGPVNNDEIPGYLAMSDLLVLPSRFDGWGAVVNEALSQGVRVLCSDRCGAEALLDNDMRGGVFKSGSQSDLKAQLLRWISKGVLEKVNRESIIRWTQQSISGDIISKYFKDVLTSKPTDAPWITPLDLTNVNIIYVGRIDRNKNIVRILQHFEEYAEHIGHFSIVGDGDMMYEVEKIANKNPKIRLYGRICNEESKKMMARHDYLILPSLYDGWGAVVNEALSAGTGVLCSDACGAGILLDGDSRGAVFTQQNVPNVIKEFCDKGPLNSTQRLRIKTWAINHISGKVAADYFCAIMNGDCIDAPWIE